MKLKFQYHKSSFEKIEIFSSFQEIFKSSFNQLYKKDTFSWKYLKSYTSESIIQEISLENKIIGYRGLWKVSKYSNSFQCIDTCIKSNYQGMGIFKKSNQNLINEIGSFYNYPNKKSKPGYLKSGWIEFSNINLYVNKIENFEFCDWDDRFLNWRFVKHPYIRYFKTKIKNGYAILRFKKNLPIHIESITSNIDLEEVKNPFFSFKYDLKKNGIKVKNAGSILTYNLNENLRSSYFDMI